MAKNPDTEKRCDTTFRGGFSLNFGIRRTSGFGRDGVITARIIQKQFQVGRHRGFQTRPDIGHIAEVHEVRGRFRLHAGPDAAVYQPAPEQGLRCADGNRVIREGGQIPPSVRIQQQIIALKQDNASVDGDGILDRVVQQTVIDRPGACGENGASLFPLPT